MSEISLVLALLVGAVALFVSQALRADVVACVVLSIVLVSGLVEPERALAGFANPATITVAAMFVISAGLREGGVIEPLGDRVAQLIKADRPALLFLLTTAALVSALINNTATVAILITVVVAACRRADASPSRYLMGLSFAAMMGGMLTLMGTSTNPLVASVATDHGLEPFGLFEFTPLAAILLVVGLLYLVTAGARLTPERRKVQDLTQDYEVGSHLSEVFVGDPDTEENTIQALRADVLQLLRDDVRLVPPYPALKKDDRVVMRLDEPDQLRSAGLLMGAEVTDKNLDTADAALVEAGVGPELEGSTLEREHLKEAYGATALAVRSGGVNRHTNLDQRVLRPGDTILFQVVRDRMKGLMLRGDSFLYRSWKSPLTNSEKVGGPLRFWLLCWLWPVLAWSPSW